MESFQTYQLPLQIGGLAGRSVAQGAHCLVSYASMRRRAGKSYAILFVDIKRAFNRPFKGAACWASVAAMNRRDFVDWWRRTNTLEQSSRIVVACYLRSVTDRDARQAFRKHCKMIFGNANLPVKTRTQLFVTLVMSVLQFNIAIWPALTNNEHQAFAKGVQSLYHSLAYWGTGVFTWRVELVAEALGLSQVDVVLRNARLRYFQHLTLKADEFVWAFIHLDPGSLGLIRADLAWLHQQFPFSAPVNPPEV